MTKDEKEFFVRTLCVSNSVRVNMHSHSAQRSPSISLLSIFRALPEKNALIPTTEREKERDREKSTNDSFESSSAVFHG